MMVLHVHRLLLCFRYSFNLLLASYLYRHKCPRNLGLYFLKHGGKQLKSFALVFLLGVFLRIAA